MTTLCTHCGMVLKEGARYCNTCGTLIPSHPLSPQSLSSSIPSERRYDNSKGVIGEPSAPQSPSRPARYSVPDVRPSWLNQLESEVSNQSKVPPERTTIDNFEELPTVTSVDRSEQPHGRVTEIPTVSWPVAPIPLTEKPEEKQHNLDVSPVNPPQLDFPVFEPMQKASAPARELHIKVWEQEDTAPSAPSKMPAEEDDSEELPTNPNIASAPEVFPQNNSILSPAAGGKTQDAHLDEVEQLDTLPLSTPKEVKPVSQPVEEHGQRWKSPLQQPVGPTDRSISDQQTHQVASMYLPLYPRPFLQPGRERPGASPAPDLKQTPSPQVPVSSQRGRKSRKPLVIALVSLLLLVIAGGAAAWVIVFQPFSVPGITQPQQSFKNTLLGFSLLYPGGWKYQLDQSKATVHFYDSTHTAQVNISVGSSNGGDLGKYLQQEANQLGMTGQKTDSPLAFAGASWQQLQGNVLQRGASYSETLLVTVHNQSLFTIMFLAPQTTYTQEDQQVFSGMRSSFKFVS